jgi:SpoVK/Ycf46/Vps4 family AAA+-type ATPase
MAATKKEQPTREGIIVPHEQYRSFEIEGDFIPSPSSYELRDLINAKPGLIWCSVEDEHRFRDNLYWLSRTLGRRIFFWTCYSGLIEWQPKEDMKVFNEDNEPILLPVEVITWALEHDHREGIGAALDEIFPDAESIQGSIIILQDMHKFLEDPMVVRALRDVGETIFWSRDEPNRKKAVIITSPLPDVCMELRDITTVMDFRLPTSEEIDGLLGCIASEGRVKNLDEEIRTEIIKGAQGMSMTRILLSARKSAARNDYELSPVMVEEEKKQIIRQSGILEIMETNVAMTDIGGMDKVKSHYELMSHSLHHIQEALERNLKTTNDILLVGIPGCGKSYAARAAGNALGVPAVRLDMGSIYNSFVGQSEANMRKALKTIEAVAPVVLLVDEVEKGMAGSQSSGQTDGGTSARVFGHFLTWMQEKPDGISVIATANDITQLPPEFLRKGRFDEIYYVGLPTESEREEIFRIHLARTAKRDPKDFDLAALAKVTEFFTGAEIEALIDRANLISFTQRKKLSNKHIIDLADGWKILYRTEQDKVQKLERLAAARWEWASTPCEKEYLIKHPTEAAKKSGKLSKATSPQTSQVRASASTSSEGKAEEKVDPIGEMKDFLGV